MKPWLPLMGIVALALAACGHGSGGINGNGAIAVPPAFQAANTTVSYQAPGAGAPVAPAVAAVGGPSSASATFTAGAGIGGAFGGAPGDTVGNSVTLTTNSNGDLAMIAISIGAPGGGPAISQTFVGGVQGGSTLSAAQFGALVQAISTSAPTVANAVYQGVVAGLTFSAYGAWMQSNGGGSYNVGMYSFGNETATVPTTGTATYNGSTLGYGSNFAIPFTFTGTAQLTANFATASVTNLQFTNFQTLNLDGTAGPALSNLSGGGTITASKYSFAIAGGTLTGAVNGTFYGPNAAETGGTWRASTAGNTMSVVGSYGLKQ